MAYRPRLVHDCDRALEPAPELIAAAAAAAIRRVPRGSEAQLRRRGAIAMTMLGVIGGFLVLQQRLTDRSETMHGLHTEGPFRATIAVNGSVQLGEAVPALHRGEAFGWAASLCAAPGTDMVLETRLVHAPDNRVLLTAARTLPADARGCSSAPWDLVLPPATPPGHYQLQRFLLLTPLDAPARTHTLPPLGVDVLP